MGAIPVDHNREKSADQRMTIGIPFNQSETRVSLTNHPRSKSLCASSVEGAIHKTRSTILCSSYNILNSKSFLSFCIVQNIMKSLFHYILR